MRRVAVIMILPLLMTGCLDMLRCWGCAESWTFQGTDGELYAALGDAEGVRAVETQGLLNFSHPRLDAAWEEYALVGFSWQPDAPYSEDEVQGRGEFFAANNLSVIAHQRVDEASIRARADELLRNVTTLDPEARATWVDAMMANRTVVGSGMSIANGTTNKTFTYGYAATFPRELLAIEPFFARLVEQDGPSWDAEQERTAGLGDVRVEGWAFTFWFPLRILQTQGNDTRFLVQANSHGGFYGSLQSTEPLSESEARALVEAMLREQGADEVDVGAWEFRGQRIGYGAPPPGVSPEPTPSIAASA